jgi:hypothetical protein
MSEAYQNRTKLGRLRNGQKPRRGELQKASPLSGD